MATFASLSETTSTGDDDLFLVSQSGVDYKQTRASVVASVANARWIATQSYTLGSEVIASDDNKYYALAGSYNQDPTTDDGTNWRIIDRTPQVENYFKINQNWNMAGVEGNAVPTTTSSIYADGEEIAAGIVADGAVTIMRSSDGLVSGTGTYYREYEGVDATDGFYGVKLSTDVISQTGVSISLVDGNTRVSVNLAAAGEHKFVGLSEGVGVWPDVSGFEIIDAIYPVGHVLLSMNSANPATYLGRGTWTAIAEGLFLAGVGTGTDQNGVDKAIVAEANDGEWEHTQTEDELVEHTHDYSGTTSTDGEHTHTYTDRYIVNSASKYANMNDEGSLTTATKTTSTAGDHTHTYSGTTSSKGSSSAMNVTTPSFGVYMWHRTA